MKFVNNKWNFKTFKKHLITNEILKHLNIEKKKEKYLNDFNEKETKKEENLLLNKNDKLKNKKENSNSNLCLSKKESFTDSIISLEKEKNNSDSNSDSLEYLELEKRNSLYKVLGYLYYLIEVKRENKIKSVELIYGKNILFYKEIKLLNENMADKEDKEFNKELSDEFIDIDKKEYNKFTNLINIYIYSIQKRIIITQQNYMELINISLK